MVTDVSLLQPLNILYGRTVMLLGIVTEDNSVLQKAHSPMCVTLLGISTEVNPQLRKALSPIDVMLLGIITEVRAPHP